MIPADVMDELSGVLAEIPGVRVPPYGGKVSPPAAVVTLPDTLTYDGSYGRGQDSMSLLIHLVVGALAARPSRDAASEFAAGSGPRSVKARLEAHAYTSCHTVHVASCEFNGVTFAAVDYLAATFTVNITGAGA